MITAYRPDPVVDPDFEGFAGNLQTLGEITNEDTAAWSGYLAAHRNRRAYFASMGATSTDHGHPTARTADIGRQAAEELFDPRHQSGCIGAGQGVVQGADAD